MVDVYCYEYCAQSRNNAVEQKLDGEEVDREGAAVTWVRNEVASNYKACLLWITHL